MKAIQVRYLAATATRPAKLKAWANGCKVLEEVINHSLDTQEQARLLAHKYFEQHGWYECAVMNGFGTLPCGDWVATMGDKKG